MENSSPTESSPASPPSDETYYYQGETFGATSDDAVVDLIYCEANNGGSIPAALPRGKEKRTLTWWRLAILTFVFTFSGPGGLEQVVIAGGPLLAVIGLFVVPVVYVMPQIFVVSEMGSMMPTSAGNVVWVHRAFGRFAGFYNAWIFALTNMVDLGSYPVLVGDYFVSTFNEDATYWEKIGYRFGALVVCISVSLLSAKDVSTFTALSTVSVVIFCVIAFCVSIPHIDPANQWTPPERDVNYSLLGSSLLWLYTGWSSIGSLAGETVHDRVLVQGMSGALTLDMTFYFMALLAALTVASSHGDWQEGFFVSAFDKIMPGIGPYFGVAVGLAALAMGISGLICYSRSLWGMAEMGWAPRFLTRQFNNGSPYAAVALHALVALVLLFVDFGFLLRIEYTIAATSHVLMYLSFVKLRYAEPDTPRPYKTPGGMPFAWLITVTKIVVMGGNCISGLIQSWQVAVAFVVCNIGVIGAYGVFRRLYPEDDSPVGEEKSASSSSTAAMRSSLTPADTGDEPLLSGRLVQAAAPSV
jgi:amino acid transporter